MRLPLPDPRGPSRWIQLDLDTLRDTWTPPAAQCWFLELALTHPKHVSHSPYRDGSCPCPLSLMPVLCELEALPGEGEDMHVLLLPPTLFLIQKSPW